MREVDGVFRRTVSPKNSAQYGAHDYSQKSVAAHGVVEPLCAPAASSMRSFVVALLVALAAAEYQQPSWDRRDESASEVHALLQRAANQHQEGNLDDAVKSLKKVLKLDAQHGEAYASLSKCYADQGNDDLAMKARVRATKLYNEQLTSFSLF